MYSIYTIYLQCVYTMYIQCVTLRMSVYIVCGVYILCLHVCDPSVHVYLQSGCAGCVPCVCVSDCVCSMLGQCVCMMRIAVHVCRLYIY